MERADRRTGDYLHRKEANCTMKGYRTFRTTMGHKIRVRMSEDEIAELELFHMILFLLPTATLVLFAFAYFGRW